MSFGNFLIVYVAAISLPSILFRKQIRAMKYMLLIGVNVIVHLFAMGYMLSNSTEDTFLYVSSCIVYGILVTLAQKAIAHTISR